MRRMSENLMPLLKPCSKSWCPQVPAAPPFCDPRRQRVSHSSAAPISHPAPSQVEGRLDSPMGTQRSLFVHFLETPWQQSSPVIAFERTHPLALEMGRPFVTKGPSAGPSAFTAHQQLLHKGSHLVPPAAGPLPWVFPTTGPSPACHYHQPFDIPAGGPEWCGGRKRKETVLGGRRKALCCLI